MVRKMIGQELTVSILIKLNLEDQILNRILQT